MAKLLLAHVLFRIPILYAGRLRMKESFAAAVKYFLKSFHFFDSQE